MFGAPLFDRSVRGMMPTALGELVLARARTITEDLGHLVSDMEAVVSGHAAHIHIGVVRFVPGRLLAAVIQRMRSEGDRHVSVTIREGTSDQLLTQLCDHTLDIVVGRASSAMEPAQIAMEVLYRQQPRLIAGRRLAARLTRLRLDWRKLAELDWILGAPRTPVREQVADIFLGVGIPPPVPVVESYSSKLIGEMVATGDRAVSIVPADIAEELVRIAGVAIVPYSFDWTLPPIAMFTRATGSRRPADRLVADSLRQVCHEIYVRPDP